MRILVVRNDKLGDFMLAWPAFALLKHYLPDAHLTALVPHYTAPIARLAPFIDELLIDAPDQGVLALARQLRSGHFDAIVTLFSTGRVGIAAALARIPYRLAPATKLAQLFYNHRLTQRRSRSDKPEYAYNLDLVWQLLFDHGVLNTPRDSTAREDEWLPPEIPRPLLKFNDDVVLLKQQFCNQHQLDAALPLLFIHPGSGGSANNLRPQQYAQLANLLARDTLLSVVISAGPGERPIAEQVAHAITAPVAIYDSSAGLAEFARTLQLAELFISGSTGPLHIAAALDRPTAAFYPGHRSATPLRWQTLNAPHKRLAFTPPTGESEREVAAIDVKAAAENIRSSLLGNNAER